MRSYQIKKGPDRAPARAMLRATGMDDKEIYQPMIAVVNTWSDVTPCNIHLRDLAGHVKEGIRAAGGTPVEFGSIVVTDGISMGSEGMKCSLMSREMVADSIELVTRGHCLDGVVALVGCDKTIPAGAMALARLDIPGMVIYGGSIMPGEHKGIPITIQDVFEAVGAYAAGKIDEAELAEVEKDACRRRLWRAVHREYHGPGADHPGRVADGRQRYSCAASGQGQSRVRLWPACRGTGP